jgi:L-asparaginase
MQREASIVVVLGTGGTIAGLAATPLDNLGYRAAQIGVAELIASAPTPARVAIESEQVAQLDSKDMDFAAWRLLAQRVAHHAVRPEVCGIVVTHGTDTLEETAYFLSRVVALAKPLVLTAAMRPASSVEADGPRNLGDAIELASQATPAGAVVVLAGRVHAARQVRKFHPHRLDAFSSGEAGVLAEIVDGRLHVLRAWPAAEDTVGVDLLPAEPSAWPWVEIVTSAAGSDGRVVDALAVAGVDGIVVAATGNGTVHRRLAEALERASRGGVVVWRSSRCLDGSILELAGDAFPAAGDLTPVQARVELILKLLVERSIPAEATASQY